MKVNKQASLNKQAKKKGINPFTVPTAPGTTVARMSVPAVGRK
jgi:hypothetical protein